MNSRQIVQELQSIVVEGSRVPGLRGRVMIDIDRLDTLGRELSNSVPAYIQEAEEIVKQKDSIINQAALEAQRVKSSAEQQAMSLTSEAQEEYLSKVAESEIIKAAEERGEVIKNDAMTEAQNIVQDAHRMAYRIIDEAEALANSRREGADQYAREILFGLEERLADLLGQVRRGIDALNMEVTAQRPDVAKAKEAAGAVQAA
jgi:vacuolar-type H+-ATPase subunit H